MWRRRRRCGRRGRFPKPVTLGIPHSEDRFTPTHTKNTEPVYIEIAELEAFRLVDKESLSQEQAGKQMGVSRGTIWRLVQSARKKTAQALVEGRPLQIRGSQSAQKRVDSG